MQISTDLPSLIGCQSFHIHRASIGSSVTYKIYYLRSSSKTMGTLTTSGELVHVVYSILLLADMHEYKSRLHQGFRTLVPFIS